MGDGLADFAEQLLTHAEAAQLPAIDRLDTSEGDALVELFFSDGSNDRWCHRRVVMLCFLAERRGQWTTSVDFTLDGRFDKPPLIQGDEVLVPLFTFSKDVMPPAHVRTEDERGDVFALASTRTSRQIECMMLIALAKRAGFLPEVLAHLAALTDTDPRTAYPALGEVERCVQGRASALAAPRSKSAEALVSFACAARLFHRSTIILVPFPKPGQSLHKVVSFTYDAPVRLTKYIPEFIGYSPLRIAPLTIFGGDSASYHAQLEPPDGVVVVNIRMLFAYTASSPRTEKRLYVREDFADRVLYDFRKWQRTPATRWLARFGLGKFPPDEEVDQDAGEGGKKATAHLPDPSYDVRARPIPPCMPTSGWRRRWSTVLGSAEPLSAHVRVGSRTLPGLIQGRDVITMFHLFPDMSAFAGVLVGAIANYCFVLAMYLDARFGLRLVHSPPEPLFIVGALIAGFGSGLALYRREHLITGQVARPWRVLFGVQVGAVLASLFVLLTCIGEKKFALTPGARTAISWCFYVASTGLAYLMLISLRAWLAQRAGGRLRSGWQGYVGRRRWFKWHWYIDERDEPKGSKRLSNWGERRARRTVRYTAERYLNDEHRRTLFNQGIPAASRHDPGSRGSTGS